MSKPQKTFNPDLAHKVYLASRQKKLAFKYGTDIVLWQKEVKEKLIELLGDFPLNTENRIRFKFQKKNNEWHEIRYIFQSEETADLPIHLLIPTEGKRPLPLVICLQGHTSGMHISLGRKRYPGDEKWIIEGDRDFALQVVRLGYAALVLEQRCFGERQAVRPARNVKFEHPCRHAAMVSLLLGRTMIGERVWDVMCAIRSLKHFPEIDLQRIACLGHSGGAMTAWFSACLDERIAAIIASGYVCNFENSIVAIDHCEDNYIPGFLKYFDLEDLAGLIVPRPLLVVAGKKDQIFPIKGVQKAFLRISEIYNAAGAETSCRLIVGSGGHRFYSKKTWPTFREITGW